jgi:hypothetical protein
MITMGSESSGGWLGTGTLDQPGNRIAQLRTLALPMTDAVELQSQRFTAFRRERIIETQTFDETAIATIARIRHHYVKIRTVLGTATGKTNDYHNETYLIN